MHHQQSSTDPPPMESLPQAPYPPPLPPPPLHQTLQTHPNASASAWFSSLPGFVHSPTSIDAPQQHYQYTPWPTSPYPDFTSAAMAAAAAASGILQRTTASPQHLFHDASTTSSPSLTPSSTTNTVPSTYFPSGEMDPLVLNVPSPSPYPLPTAAASSEDVWRAMQMLPSPSMGPTTMHAEGDIRRSASTGNLQQHQQSMNVMTPARILAGEKSRGRTTLPVVSSPLGLSASIASTPDSDPAVRRKAPARRRAGSKRDDDGFDDGDEEDEPGRLGRRKANTIAASGVSSDGAGVGVRSAFHKMVEQKRREQLRDAFDSLVHSLPPEYLRPGWVVRRNHNVRSLQFAMEATRAIVDAATAAAAGKRRGREEDDIVAVGTGGRRATGARGVKTAMSISKRPFLSAVRKGANLKEEGAAGEVTVDQQLQKQQQQQQQQQESEIAEIMSSTDVASSAATLNRVDILVRVLYFITELQERERERERTMDELRQRLHMLRAGSVGAGSVVSESSSSGSSSSSTGMVLDG